jgi:hypothetical protein
MTVETALAGFRFISALKANGLAIGGPACAVDSDDWMKSFMSQATAPPFRYNMDFIGYHTYASADNPVAAADGVLGFCDYIWKLYHKPIWATEWAPTHLSKADSLIFIRLVCQGFQSRAFVQRYAMFTSEPPAETGMGASCLVNTDGSLTDAGKLYARM